MGIANMGSQGPTNVRKATMHGGGGLLWGVGTQAGGGGRSCRVVEQCGVSVCQDEGGTQAESAAA